MQNVIVLKQRLMFVNQLKKLEAISKTFLMHFQIVLHLLQIAQCIHLFLNIWENSNIVH